MPNLTIDWALLFNYIISAAIGALFGAFGVFLKYYLGERSAAANRKRELLENQKKEEALRREMFTRGVPDFMDKQAAERAKQIDDGFEMTRYPSESTPVHQNSALIEALIVLLMAVGMIGMLVSNTVVAVPNLVWNGATFLLGLLIGFLYMDDRQS